MLMKQPLNMVDVLHPGLGDDYYTIQIELIEEGRAVNWSDVAYGRTRKAALRAAARRLRSLANECDKMAERGE